jgi:DNA polymerase-2
VPRTLSPLLGKRIAFKNRMASTPRWNPQRKSYEARASAQKWLLVTCFGYLGYKNARFGRIEAHEAVTAYGREALLRAKETAEEMGYEVLHMYVDGMWVKKDGAATIEALQPLLEKIAERTGLPIALDAMYRWVAFLPSRIDRRVPVANRYFGVYQDGTLKVRGIEARRRDAPPFVVDTQLEILGLLASGRRREDLGAGLKQVFALLRRKLVDLRRDWVPLEDLLVKQKLSRELDEYRVPSPSARAAFQLQTAGKTLRAGQSVRFLYTRGKPGVHAWDLPYPLERASLDLDHYKELLLRAAEAVLEPFGYDRNKLEERLYGYKQTVATDLFSYGGAGVYSLDALIVPGKDTFSQQDYKSDRDFLLLQDAKTGG